MIYWIRTLYLLIKAFLFDDYYENNSLPYDADHIYEMRVLPYDLDMNFHLNNAQYLSFMEHARFDMILKHANVFNRCRRKGYGWVVAGVSFQFRRSANLFDKVRIVTNVAGADEKWLYVQQNFYVGKRFIGRGIVRMCTFDKNGAVSTARYFKDILRVDIETADPKFRMTKDDYAKIINTDSFMSASGGGDSKEDILTRVSSFVFHDETLKEK